MTFEIQARMIVKIDCFSLILVVNLSDALLLYFIKELINFLFTYDE
jgi:hypothetical protein